MNRWTAGTGWAALVGAAVLLLGGCPNVYQPAPAATGQVAAGRPECPARDDSLIVHVKRGTVRLAFASVPLAGPISNVPEYHDCQRLLMGNRSDAYGPLVGVWAAYQLDSILADTASSDTIKAVAELLSWGPAYPPLGIEPLFDCLYLTRSAGGWTAKMVPVGEHADGCRDRMTAARAGTSLAVIPRPLAGLRGDSLEAPPVARWEWSDATGVQYIGIKCGPHTWCSVGPAGFVPASLPDPRLLAVDPGISAAAARRDVMQVPGWFDEQRLAPPRAPDPRAASPVRAIIVPHEALGAYGESDFQGRWAPVAFVRFLPAVPSGAEADNARLRYKEKLGFGLGNTTSVIWLCNGLKACAGITAEMDSTLPGRELIRQIPRAAAPPGAAPPGANPAPTAQPPQFNEGMFWWARIVAGSDTTYRRVVRCDHSRSGVDVPGTARWRWALGDEKVWVRCVNGCCEVQGGM